jgi:hypothetical protein
MPDKQGWWVKGMTNCVWARSPVGYLAKYASKGGDGSAFPAGLRAYGRAGISLHVRITIAWCLAPAWLKRMVPVEHGVERVTWCDEVRRYGCKKRVSISGWWRDLVTRIEYRTPWRAEFIPGVGVLLSLDEWTEDDVRFPA